MHLRVAASKTRSMLSLLLAMTRVAPLRSRNTSRPLVIALSLAVTRVLRGGHTITVSDARRIVARGDARAVGQAHHARLRQSETLSAAALLGSQAGIDRQRAAGPPRTSNALGFGGHYSSTAVLHCGSNSRGQGPGRLQVADWQGVMVEWKWKPLNVMMWQLTRPGAGATAGCARPAPP
jgi:hypothetical protein